jgi:general secretion pathway protein I
MTARITSPAESRGFTLIEVLAALVIVGLGMLAAIEAVNQSVRNGTYLREKTLAHWIGMNVITERRLQPAAPDVGETSDQVEFASQRWRWTMKVTQTQVASMRRMDVSVRPASAPDGAPALATVSGFYGAAVGPAGGGTLMWAGEGSPGSGGDPQADEPAERPDKPRNDRPASPARPRPTGDEE